MVDNNMALRVKLLEEGAVLPTRGTPDSAGYDLSSLLGYRLDPGERKLIRTGLAIAVPRGFYGRIAPRSGLAFKHGIDVLAGVVDSDYRNEVGVILLNTSTQRFIIKPQDRIAQLIIEAIFNPEVIQVEELEVTDRSGGFGSTGVGAPN